MTKLQLYYNVHYYRNCFPLVNRFLKLFSYNFGMFNYKSIKISAKNIVFKRSRFFNVFKNIKMMSGGLYSHRCLSGFLRTLPKKAYNMHLLLVKSRKMANPLKRFKVIKKLGKINTSI